MLKKFKICKKYIQLSTCVYFLVICPASAQINRTPANFVPDDDLIIVPIVIEENVIDKFNEKHAVKFRGARDTLRFWIAQEAYSEAYGLEGRGIVAAPTEREKKRFLQRNYLRFLSKDIERSTNNGVKNALNRWTANDEIDALEAIEEQEKILIRAEGSGSTLNNLKSTKTVKIGKKSRIKIGFQPRVEIGMLKFTLKSDFIKLRAWVGINGNQEFNIERKIKSTGTRAFLNYKIDETRLLMAIDQRIGSYTRLRITHQKDVEGFSQITQVGTLEDNAIQLRFSKAF